MQSVLITGASSGFGQLTAIELTRLGWQVFAAMRDPSSGAGLKDAVRVLGLTERLHLVPMDVTQVSSIDAAVAQVLTITGGTLDAVLNNAGFTTMGFFEDMSDAQARSVMETNFFGAVAVTRAAVPIMRRAGHGRIVFVSSNAVNCPHPTMTMYAASKCALEGFAEGLAMELAPFGVEVVVLQPGNHRTPFGSNVKVIQPPASAYTALWQALMPALEALGANGAEPANALPAFVQSIVEPGAPFLLPIGRDVKLFSRLRRRTRSFEARAWAVRHFVGFPGGRHRP